MTNNSEFSEVFREAERLVDNGSVRSAIGTLEDVRQKLKDKKSPKCKIVSVKLLRLYIDWSLQHIVDTPDVAVSYLLKADDIASCFEANRARQESVDSEIIGLHAVALNNLAIVHAQKGFHNQAYLSLLKALEIETTVKSRRNRMSMAKTHLNMCAVLCQMRRHRRAANHAYLAFKLMEQASRRKSSEEMKAKVDQIMATAASSLKLQALILREQGIVITIDRIVEGRVPKERTSTPTISRSPYAVTPYTPVFHTVPPGRVTKKEDLTSPVEDSPFSPPLRPVSPYAISVARKKR